MPNQGFVGYTAQSLGCSQFKVEPFWRVLLNQGNGLPPSSDPQALPSPAAGLVTAHRDKTSQRPLCH